MKTIKTYEDFINEEINLKKALATGALAAGMALSNPAHSQTTNVKSDTIEMSKDETAFTYVEEEAEFPGGYTALTNYIKSNMRYPSNKDVSGRVFLEFVVEKNGTISNIEVTRGIEDYPEFEIEAIRLLENSPKWKPAKNDGKYVRSVHRLPITFKYDSSKITQSNNPISNVSIINKDQVSDIKNYETMASIKLPKDFDPANAKIYSSLLWDSNIPNAPFGGMFFIHTPKLSFFIDVKSTWKNFSGEYGIKNWVEIESFVEEYNTWQTSYGSFTRVHHDKNVSVGALDHKRVFDIGISKSISKSESFDLRAYIGCGLSISKTDIFEKTEELYREYTHYAALGYDTDWSEPDMYLTYDKVATTYENKLNITSGLLFDFKSGFQMGIGYDTQPRGINLMIGFTMGKH
jgi:hypothetical protein